MAQKLDMEFYNIAIGGSNANVDQVQPLEMLPKVDLMTILWGFNDCINKGKTLKQYTSDMNAVLDRIRDLHKETPIYLLNLLQARVSKSKKTDFTLDDFRKALNTLYLTRVSNGDKNLFFIHSEKMTNIKDDLGDVVHLSHKGHRVLSEKVFDTISK